MPMTYKSPLRDLRFVYYELFDGDELARLPGFEDATQDTVEAVLEEMGKIASEVLQPLNGPGDEQGCRLENGAVRAPDGFRDAWKLLREGGWMGLTARPEYGGQGMPYSVGVAASELMIAANLSFSMYVFLTHGAYDALDHHASDELKEMFLPKLVDGSWAGTMCLTESQSGTDLGLVRTRAVDAGDGAWKLTGSKIFISAGDHDLAENIVHLVLARTPDAPPGIKGISMFLVPKLRPEGGRLVPNGVSCPSIEHKLGIKGSATCVIDFDGSTGYLVGEPHKGMRAMFTMMNAARLHVGVQGLALSEAGYQAATAFARERLQGRALTGARYPDQEADPILVHPDVRRMLLSIRAFNEGARALTAWIAMAIDHAESDPDPARREEADDLASLLTPIVKAFQTDLGFEMANVALQVHGGYGYVREYGIEQVVRDARITQIYEGTNGIQALDLVGRKMPAHTGRALRRFFHPVSEFLAAESGNEALAEFTGPLAKAVDRLQRSTLWLATESMKNPEQAGAAATDFLHLFGWTALAYLWARMAKVAQQKLADGGTGLSAEERAFYDAKLRTARFFVERLLPRTSGHFANLMSGSRTMMEFPDSAF
ncbi:MAG: acyl-CoA dehydrogenase [Thermoanaerobaculia bacterium]|nr:MAG: acyl-CoA dehydrogenase [Thermoanaerobaculia bacterium]MBZ0103644.1 acyl-CoA dehydrogenase C-terminal domain-containing protein [Thermoanaerobaculia bacterium]